MDEQSLAKMLETEVWETGGALYLVYAGVTYDLEGNKIPYFSDRLSSVPVRLGTLGGLLGKMGEKVKEAHK